MAEGDELVVHDFTEEESGVLLRKCMELRRCVFIEEEKVEEAMEVDSLDDQCVHVAVTACPPLLAGGDNDENKCVIGTCRLHCENSFVKLERVAVRKDWRGKAIGSLLCKRAIRVAERKFARYLLVTHAQLHCIEFYEKLGFIVVSDVYSEADILHKTMIYPPRCERIQQLFVLEKEVEVPHEFIPGDSYDPEIRMVIIKILRSFSETCRPRLLHYQHELESKVIGESLVRVFRECALALLSGNTGRCEKLEEFLLAFAWEKLNTGHYSLVDDAWRELYAAVSTSKAMRLFKQKLYKDALRAADFGLMMGGDIDGRSLSAFATHLHSTLPLPPSIICQRSCAPHPQALPNSRQVRRIHRPSMEEFLEYFVRGEPVVITGIVTQWPAFTKWSFEYFNKIAGHRTVPIEIGSSYAAEEWKQTFMTVHDYIKEFIEQESPRGLGYLAQHRMFEQMPELLKDLILPDYYSFRSMDDVDLMIWLGPAGTVSPLHTDPKSNIFCQVHGRKFFRLVPYTESDYIYRNTDGLLTNTSQMDVEKPDLTKFPLFASAHVLDCIVEAGDSLFIPPQYWHHVRSLDPSISIACWFHEQ